MVCDFMLSAEFFRVITLHKRQNLYVTQGKF